MVSELSGPFFWQLGNLVLSAGYGFFKNEFNKLVLPKQKKKMKNKKNNGSDTMESLIIGSGVAATASGE